MTPADSPLTPEALAQAVAEIRERATVAPNVSYTQTPTLSIFRDHDNSLAEHDVFGDVTVWDNDVVFSDAACALFASAKSDIGLLLDALTEAEARRQRAEAALLALVNDMRGVDFYYVPSDIQRQVHDVVPENRQVWGRSQQAEEHGDDA